MTSQPAKGTGLAPVEEKFRTEKQKRRFKGPHTPHLDLKPTWDFALQNQCIGLSPTALNHIQTNLKPHSL